MTRIISLLGVLMFISGCGSKDRKAKHEMYLVEKSLIEQNLKLHNISAAAECKMAANRMEHDLRNRYSQSETLENLIKKKKLYFINEWNSPYDINKDTALTYEKYIEFCVAHNYDTATYYKYISQ